MRGGSIRPAMGAVSNPAPAIRPRRGIGARLDRMPEGRFAAVIATPGLLLVVLFVVPPILAVLGLSLFRAELGIDTYRPFIALRNYAVRLGTDTAFFESLSLTVVFAAITTALAVPIALGTAALIHGRSGRLAGVLGLLLLLPWAVAPVADGLFWKLMFDARSGLMNQALGAIGLPIVDLARPPGVLVATVVAVVWRAIPLLGVLLLGALRQVPPEIGRAARMDGASGWQVMRHVTLPAIAPMLIAASLLQVVLALQVFEVQFALTGDTPPLGSMLSGFVIYRTVIGQISLGYGSAITVVLGLIIALCLLLLYRFVVRPAGLAGGAGARDDMEVVPLDVAHRPDLAHFETSGDPVAPRGASAGGAAAAFGPVVRPRGRGVAIGVVHLRQVGPPAWIAIASTQANADLRASPPRLSAALRLDEYRRLIEAPDWQAAATVSITVTVLATVIAVGVALLVAYPLARFRLRGSRPILLLLLATQLIPPIALAIPVLLLFAGLGLRNTIAGLVLVNVAFWTPILVWLLRSALLAVPHNLERAARMDGVSRVGTIVRIAIPAAAPALAAAAAIVFVGIWNDFTFVAVLGGRDTSTLPRYLGQSFTPSYPTLAATIVLTVAPCLLLVALLRRRILGLF